MQKTLLYRFNFVSGKSVEIASKIFVKYDQAAFLYNLKVNAEPTKQTKIVDLRAWTFLFLFLDTIEHVRSKMSNPCLQKDDTERVAINRTGK